MGRQGAHNLVYYVLHRETSKNELGIHRMGTSIIHGMGTNIVEWSGMG